MCRASRHPVDCLAGRSGGSHLRGRRPKNPVPLLPGLPSRHQDLASILDRGHE